MIRLALTQLKRRRFSLFSKRCRFAKRTNLEKTLSLLSSVAEMAKRFSAQLFVSRLSAYTTDRSLRQLFSPFGQIKEARLIRDPETQRPKGFGFITFESEDDARKAMKSLDGKIVDGRLIFVEVAKNVEEVATNMNSKKTEDCE